MIYGNSILDCNDHTDPRDPEYDDEFDPYPPLFVSVRFDDWWEEWQRDDD